LQNSLALSLVLAKHLARISIGDDAEPPCDITHPLIAYQSKWTNTVKTWLFKRKAHQKLIEEMALA
jgi:hypothetical protein